MLSRGVSVRSGFEPARPQAALGPPGGRLPGCAGVPPSSEKIRVDVGRFFLDLRRTFRLTQVQAAKKLATRAEIVAALETGDIGKFPPWPETCRIVRTYTGLAGLDPRPVLNLIEILLKLATRPPAKPAGRGLLARLSQPRSPEPARTAPPVRAVEQHDDDGPGRLAAAWQTFKEVLPGRSLRALLALSVPVAIVVLLTQTTMLEAAVAKLPPSVARIVRGAQNYVIVQLAPVRDGLRWIDVPDPRTRRSDKLQTAAQSD